MQARSEGRTRVAARVDAFSAVSGGGLWQPGLTGLRCGRPVRRPIRALASPEATPPWFASRTAPQPHPLRGARIAPCTH